MIRMDATTLATVTNRCTDMMQSAAVAYYAQEPDAKTYHTEVVLRELRTLAERLGFDLVKREPVDAVTIGAKQAAE